MRRFPALLLINAILFGGGGCSDAAGGRALDRRELAARRLAGEVTRLRPGVEVLVVGNPFTQRPNPPAGIVEYEAAALAGVRAGLGSVSRLSGIAYPELNPAAAADPSAVPMPADATTPLSFLTAAGAWDRLAQAHPTSRVLVSLIGLPADWASHQLAAAESPVSLALLLPDFRVLGPRDAVKSAFISGKLLAAVLSRPGAPPESEPPLADAEAEFARRYVLLTTATFDAVVQEFPQLVP